MNQFEVENRENTGADLRNGAGRGGPLGNVPMPALIGGGVIGVVGIIAIGVVVASSGGSAGTSGGTGTATPAPTPLTPMPTERPGPTPFPTFATPAPTPLPPGDTNAPTDSPAPTDAPTKMPTRYPTPPTSPPTTPAPTPPTTPAPTLPRGPATIACPARATAPKPAGPGRQREDIVKGISYGPAPLKELGSSSLLPHDDFWEDDSSALWKKRGDLKIMQSLGANTVRLYGNHAGKNHKNFLDESASLGLQVVAGMSDWPYTQSDDNCAKTSDLNCYHQVKAAYGANLDNGMIVKDENNNSHYHLALHSFIIVNEPDIKLGGGNPVAYQKALISAFDAVLDAEKERNITDTRLKFTITVSFGQCPLCSCYKDKSAVGIQYDFRHACQYPEQFGYNASNDLWAAFQTRFINSANTFNPSDDLEPQFLNDYEVAFGDTKTHMYFGEYNNQADPARACRKRQECPDASQQCLCPTGQEEDMKATLALARKPGGLFDGFSFFEFQIRYDKGGDELAFGMLGLGDSGPNFLYENITFTAYCLTANKDERTHEVFHTAVAKAFGGSDIDQSSLCQPTMEEMIS